MESIDLDMDDMFEEREVDNDVAAVDQGSNDMMDTEAGQDGADQDENGDLQSQMVRRLRDGAAKKVIKNPQPKLDAERLNSDRGFPALRKIFEKVKFKGKGHEVSDFLLTMRTMEHWAHRLFPKMTFDEVIERCERLGKKAQVKTIVQKIRMGEPVLDEEFVDRHGDNNSDDDDDDDDADAANPSSPRRHDEHQSDAEQIPDPADEFEEMMRDATPSSRRDDGDTPDDFMDAVSTPTRSQAPPLVSSARTTPAGGDTTPAAVTPGTSMNGSRTFNDEQLSRMEKNKLMAMEKRKARMLNQQGGSAIKSRNSTITSSQTAPPVQSSPRRMKAESADEVLVMESSLRTTLTSDSSQVTKVDSLITNSPRSATSPRSNLIVEKRNASSPLESKAKTAKITHSSNPLIMLNTTAANDQEEAQEEKLNEEELNEEEFMQTLDDNDSENERLNGELEQVKSSLEQTNSNFSNNENRKESPEVSEDSILKTQINSGLSENALESVKELKDDINESESLKLFLDSETQNLNLRNTETGLDRETETETETGSYRKRDNKNVENTTRAEVEPNSNKENQIPTLANNVESIMPKTAAESTQSSKIDSVVLNNSADSVSEEMNLFLNSSGSSPLRGAGDSVSFDRLDTNSNLQKSDTNANLHKFETEKMETDES